MQVEIFSSRQFPAWLAQQNISLALTTYQTGQLIFLGVNPSGQLSGFQRLYDRAMGLYTTSERLYLSCKSQLWQLDNALAPGEEYKSYDRLYIPRIGYTTGDLDIHDLAIDREDRIIFVSSLLNCLATVSDRKSCKPLWKPSFISRVVNEDRCHLNGMAMVDGRPSYVTACSKSDLIDGWRDRRIGGGIVIDVASNELVCTGLTMPHSPRWYRDKLWLLNSGRGELGYVDLQTGKFEAVAFCPGYLRGLAFWENYAIVGLSKPRAGDRTFSGLPLDDLLQAKDGDARCGLMVVDLNTGAITDWVRFEGKITELYDVQIIPDAKRPMALGFQTEEIAQLISLEPMASLDSPSDDAKKLLVIAKHSNGGFFSNFNKVLQLIGKHSQDYDFRVDWTFTGTEEAFRYGDEIGENMWSHFFEPLSGEADHFYSETKVVDSYSDYSITHVNAHRLYLHQNFDKVRQQYHAVYQQYIKVKPDIIEEVDNFFAANLAGNLCLGVHKRHLLHRIEEFSQTAVSVKDYIEAIRQLLAQSGAEKIFLATDETEAVTEFKQAFGDRLICRTDITRASVEETQEMHWQAKNKGSNLGREVLIDALLLAKCDLLLHGVSNISTAIAFMNPDLKMCYLYTDERGQRLLRRTTTEPALTVGQTQVFSKLGSFDLKLQAAAQTQKSERGENSLELASTAHSAPKVLALLDRSSVLKKQKDLAQAEVCLRQAIDLQPDCWRAFNNLGTILQNQGNIKEAKRCYQKAIEFNADFAHAISNLASISQIEEDWERAKNGFNRALQLKPDYVPAHLNLAHLYKQQQRLGGAVEHFQRVIALKPDCTEAYFNLGQIFEYQGKIAEALEYYQQAQSSEPNSKHFACYITMAELRLCDWENYENKLAELVKIVKSDYEVSRRHRFQTSAYGFNSYTLNAFSCDPTLHQIAAQNQAQIIAQNVASLKARVQFKHQHSQPQKLRIGFISPDFREHAVGRLIYQIFPHFDRDRFEIYAYSTVDVDDWLTQEVRSGCDTFVDLSHLSTEAAARRIYDDGIHVVVDLAGYTIGNAANVLALQPAPIQAQWLGYPDTMGADFIQYYLGDRTLITDEIAQHYTEEIIYLPHAFVASPLKISEKPMTRAEFGLPDDAFVFCCFNSHYKITPELFDLWLRILERVPQSVLWLAAGAGKDNLRREAKKRGLADNRLIFAKKIAHEDYLARYALADLYLDTFIYNAGSTATAVLWSGLPMLTCPGKINASRMGASICKAAELEATICQSAEDYEARAVYLATHPQELAQLRQQLQDKLNTPANYPPLFKLENFVRSLEKAIEQMWAKYSSKT